MARTPSNMIPLKSKATNFTLPDFVSKTEKTLLDIKGGNGTLIMFICNHCPFVIHVMERIVLLEKKYNQQGIQFIAINSNDVTNYPDDSPEKMTNFAKKYNFDFPYLFDESQEIAKNYDAACTPDFYLYNSILELTYRGQMDDSRPDNNKPNDGKDLDLAIQNILNQKPPVSFQKPSLGCNIKWKN